MISRQVRDLRPDSIPIRYASRFATLIRDLWHTGPSACGTCGYYGARYYDPEIGRFISADTIVPDPMDPQAFNRYSYCLNNPLKYEDPTGHWGIFSAIGAVVGAITGAATYAITTPKEKWTTAGWVGSTLGGAVAGALTGGLSCVLNSAGAGTLATGFITGGLSPGIGVIGLGVEKITEWAMGGEVTMTPQEALTPVAGMVTGPA